MIFRFYLLLLLGFTVGCSTRVATDFEQRTLQVREVVHQILENPDLLAGVDSDDVYFELRTGEVVFLSFEKKPNPAGKLIRDEEGLSGFAITNDEVADVKLNQALPLDNVALPGRPTFTLYLYEAER